MAEVSPEIAELLYRRLKRTQRDFGRARLELGTLLEVFRQNEALWRGRGESYFGFLEEERIQPDGAKQFMRVAKKFVLELALDEATLDDLACVNFRILDLAARIITPENQDEVLSLVLALGERDAKVALAELSQPNVAPVQRMSREVQSLLGRFRQLPDDYRSAFMEQLNGKRRGNAGREQVAG